MIGTGWVTSPNAVLRYPQPVRDALIAATALVHGMPVVTRKVSDFAPTGVDVIVPWQAGD